MLARPLGGWHLVLIVPLISLLAAGVGAYIGAYLSEKGKSRATREDLQDIVRRTEEIKVEVSRAAGLRQEQQRRQAQASDEVNALLAEFFTDQMSSQDYKPSIEFFRRWFAATGMVRVLFSPQVNELFREVDRFI